VPSSQALPGFLITAPPSACDPAAIGAQAVWIENPKKKIANLWFSEFLKFLTGFCVFRNLFCFFRYAGTRFAANSGRTNYLPPHPTQPHSTDFYFHTTTCHSTPIKELRNCFPLNIPFQGLIT